ncbi:MAG: RNA chaperone Hfq [Bacillota bacterium]
MTAKAPVNLQDAFLNQIRKEGIQTTVYLINGFQLKGVVKGFDNFTVVLDSDGKQMLIYKHAMSTVTPQRPVNTNFTETGEKPKTSE